jgi:hypothetical protein
MVLLASEVKGSAGASFQFASISGAYNHLRLILNVRCSAAVFDSVVAIRFNADSSAIYDSVRYQLASATTLSAAEQFAQTSAFIGNAPGASGPANVPGVITLDIPAYALTVFQKGAVGVNGLIGTSTGNDRSEKTILTWRSTAAITQIDIILLTGTNFVIGSGAWLYGIL